MKFDECASILSQNSVTIFLLHGVITDQNWHVRNFNRKHILDIEFKKFLQDLLQVGEAVSMNDIIEHTTDNSLPKNSFAITFDDGFENNLSVAAPILEELSIPATFYITSNFVESNLMSWADRIDWAIEEMGNRTISKLQVPWRSKSVELFSANQKINFLKEVRHYTKNNKSIDQNELANDIQNQLKLPLTYCSENQLDLKLSWNEVKKLSQCQLFTVGGHTHSHPIMSFLKNKELISEIKVCLDLLKKKANIETAHFAYPEGLAHCYNEKVINELKKFGIKCCPSAEEGLNSLDRELDLFRLKRIFVE